MTQISKLVMQGFKSFAKRTELEFPDNFTLVIGPNGAGKCVTGDTLVHLADGTLAEIRALVDEAFSKHKPLSVDDGCIGEGDGRKVLCMDANSLKVAEKEISHYVKRKSPEKLLKIATRSGRSIIATPYHPLFVLSEGKVTASKAEDLKEGVRVAVPRLAKVSPETNCFYELIDLITPEDSIFVPFNPLFAELLKKAKERMNRKQFAAAAGVPETSIAGLLDGQSINFSYLVKLLRHAGKTDNEIIRLIPEIKGKTTSKTCRMPWRSTPELARLLGYLLAEGRMPSDTDQIWFTNGTEEIVKDYLNLVSSVFGLRATVNEYKPNTWDVLAYSHPMQVILSKLGMGFHGTGSKTITNLFLRHSGDEELANLLNGLYSGDGYVSDKSIELTTKSKNLATAVESILTRLGITFSSKWQVKLATNSGFSGLYKTIYAYGAANASSFQSAIELVHPDKKRRISIIAAKKSNPNLDVLEVNQLVKSTAKELGLKVKNLKASNPKLDAYCYNTCLPTTGGAQQLIAELFDKSSVASDSQSLKLLKKLAYSDIYWDEITELTEVQPKDEWVYDLCVEKDHNFIANNMFVHNSNVLDSLCFVLGRRSSKELRTEKLAHLIYNGGKTKQPASKGEVSIFFDNAQKIFPLDSPSIKLSRIVKPSGQSVYRINDKAHTRQEILDMMALAKINPDGYNIVLQGDINRFVEMSSEERRQIIEDIAGIGVYEEKKKKALGELERVDARIREAEILLAERKTHLKELKNDRDQALKYRELNDKIKQYRATYLHLQMKSKSSRKEGFDTEMAELNKQIAETKTGIEKLKAGVEEKKKETTAITEEVEQKGEAEQIVIHRSIEQARVDIATANNRAGFISSELEKVASRKEQLASDLKELDAKVAGLASKSSELLKEKETATKEKGRLESEVKKLRGADVSDIAKIEEQLTRLDRESEALQAEVQAAVERKQQLLREKDKTEFQIASLDESIKKVAEIEKTNKAELEQLEAKRKEFKKTVLELNKMLSEDSTISATIGDIKRRLYKANEDFTKLKMQHLALRERAFGSNAVKEILEQDKIKGIHGTVSQLGTVQKTYAAALEAAAGPRINSIVVDDDLVASKCIKYLKERKVGRATFLPLNKLRSSEGKPAKVKEDGVHGPAVELVSFDPKYKSVFDYVFGNTLVVDSIDTARTLGIGKYRMVTLDGDLTELSGAMHGGFRQKTTTAFQEGDIGKSVSGAEKSVTELEESLSVHEKKKLESEETIAGLRGQKAALEGEIIKAEKSLHLESSDADVSRKNKEQLNAELKSATAELSTTEAKAASISKKIAEKKAEKLRLREQISSLGNPAVLAELAALGQKISELKERELAIDNEVNNSKVQSEEILAQEKSRITQILKQISKDEENFRAEREHLTKTAALQKKQLAEMEAKAVKFHAKNKTLFEKRNKLIEEMQSSEEKIIRKEEQINTVEVKINNITLKASEIAGELAGLQEDFSQYSDVKLLENETEENLKADISRYERSAAQMGNVNLKALEIYEDVEKQYGELLQKKDTLVKEKGEVVTMMSEIESKKSDLFMNTFNTLNANFKSAFTELSSKGSEAYLMLENEQNPFEGGVRIRVRVVGEKFMDIRSLSGGEKTMTALAFIFSIQEYEPASFYIFDEVDAALDKKNAEKFAQLIRKYSSKAQYIVISHNDNVITEANTLYGVSMDEHGISNVVSLKV